MFLNYLTIAFRNMTRQKAYSFINITGLAVGMAVALLIGLWIWDELSFNKYHANYNRIARVMQHQTQNGSVDTQSTLPYIIETSLRENYGSSFTYVVMATSIRSRILSTADKHLSQEGAFMGKEAPEMLSLKMLNGTRSGLQDMHSIMLSQSAAKAFFGEENPLGKLMQLDNKLNVKVSGVYADLPYSSSFKDMHFIVPFDLYLHTEKWVKETDDPWRLNAFQAYVQLAGETTMDDVTAKIKNSIADNISKEKAAARKPEVFLHPMAKWHLYPDFKNGVATEDRIEFIWMAGMIGLFVLLLACINFMNLSTARYQKRAREVGIRKVIGSVKGQLVTQFLAESMLMCFVAFLFCLLLLWIALPYFNELADKQMSVLWTEPLFWMLGIGFCLLTGLVAGSYPAFYLSSFQPIQVLKGIIGRGASHSLYLRKGLVVVQFTVSLTLIIGTIIVFRQIEFAKGRPMGYSRNNLLMLQLSTKELHTHFEAFRHEVKQSGAVLEAAESQAPVTGTWSSSSNFDWKGKDPNRVVDIFNTGVSQKFGETVGWQFVEGRDFSPAFPTDYQAMVINQAAVKFMGLDNPVGETIKWWGKPFTIIGVIQDMIVESPYGSAKPYFFYLANQAHAGTYLMHFFTLKLNPAVSTSHALHTISTVFKKYSPSTPFDYTFVDEEYAKKFVYEERIAKIVSVFAALAIFISCLGMFGLASFTAQSRIKEMSIRKVLGASVFNIWHLLSKEFVTLVALSLLLASPIAMYFLGKWLENYEYRTTMSAWIFIVSGAGALFITLATVSFQAIKTALVNPVHSLRNE